MTEVDGCSGVPGLGRRDGVIQEWRAAYTYLVGQLWAGWDAWKNSWDGTTFDSVDAAIRQITGLDLAPYDALVADLRAYYPTDEKIFYQLTLTGLWYDAQNWYLTEDKATVLAEEPGNPGYFKDRAGNLYFGAQRVQAPADLTKCITTRNLAATAGGTAPAATGSTPRPTSGASTTRSVLPPRRPPHPRPSPDPTEHRSRRRSLSRFRRYANLSCTHPSRKFCRSFRRSSSNFP